MVEQDVINPFGERVPRELEPRPEQLKMATQNNFGLDVIGLLKGLGFVPSEYTSDGRMVLVTTPERLLGKEWAIFYQDKEEDPNLFTICLNHREDVGYMEFLMQTRNRHGYCIFIP